jgi:hypothetical protein
VGNTLLSTGNNGGFAGDWCDNYVCSFIISAVARDINGNPIPYADQEVYATGPLGQHVTGVWSAVATTPLPSTWLMLLSGFFGLGLLAYRGTKKRTALAAA